MRALLSVYDKTGLLEFAQGLRKLGFELISTGKTQRFLQEAGLPVYSVEAVTGVPELLGGRVKTLHPTLHAGILAKHDQSEELEHLGIQRIQVVACNLYPFRETLARGATFEELLEEIDIGGVALLRAAAKNHPHTLPLCDPSDYPRALDELSAGVSAEFRRYLAHKVFAYTASYDAAIARWLAQETPAPLETLPLTQVRPLRYGENPHQRAWLYRIQGEEGPLVSATPLGGKELGFNNYADAEAAWLLAQELSETACVAVKHGNPCGVALGATPKEAWERARDADTLSIFGGVVAFNRPVDLKTAEATRGTFLEVLIAPSVDPEALQFFKSKKPDLRMLEAGPTATSRLEFRPLLGGFLVQERDQRRWEDLTPQVVTRRSPTPREWEDLQFAWYVSKYARSNSIVLAREKVTVGIGTGAVSRIWAAERALRNAGERAQGAVLVSEAFFPFDDVVRAAAEAGITAILQPGGAKRDSEVIQAAEEHGLAMVFTGSRHFRH